MCAHSRCGSGIILNDPRRRKILEGSGVRAPPGNFLGFLLLESPFLVSESFRQDIGQISTWKVFLLLKMYYYD